jgi:hypothetical protein
VARPAAKTITWISLTEERDLVAQEYLSPKYAEQWIADRLAAADLEWRAKAVIPPGYSTENFWQYPSPSWVGPPVIDWVENSAKRATTAPVAGVGSFEYVTLVGIEVRQRQATARAPERRGRKPDVTKQVAAEMVRRAGDGKETIAGLRDATQESLAAGYGASRETVVRAREIALSELLELQSRQFPTRK